MAGFIWRYSGTLPQSPQISPHKITADIMKMNIYALNFTFWAKNFILIFIITGKYFSKPPDFKQLPPFFLPQNRFS